MKTKLQIISYTLISFFFLNKVKCLNLAFEKDFIDFYNRNNFTSKKDIEKDDFIIDMHNKYQRNKLTNYDYTQKNKSEQIEPLNSEKLRLALDKTFKNQIEHNLYNLQNFTDKTDKNPGVLIFLPKIIIDDGKSEMLKHISDLCTLGFNMDMEDFKIQDMNVTKAEN